MFSSFTRSFGYGRRKGGSEAPAYGNDATFSLSSSFDARNEGNTVRITLTTSLVGNGVSIPYTITGISSSDLSSGSITGNFVINSNTASLDFTFAQDQTGEGQEIMTITLNNHPSVSKSVIINDTSVWGPNAISSSLVAWLDASDMSSYTLVGSTVTAITDKTGTYGGLDVIGTPTRIGNSLNGLAVFDFSGSECFKSSSTYKPQVSSGNHWAIGIFRYDSSKPIFYGN